MFHTGHSEIFELLKRIALQGLIEVFGAQDTLAQQDNS